MSSRDQILPFHPKKTKRRKGQKRRRLMIASVITLTSSIVKRFQDIWISDIYNYSLPFKKRKLNLNEKMEANCQKPDYTVVIIDVDDTEDLPVAQFPPPNRIHAPDKNDTKRLNTHKKSPEVKSKKTVKTSPTFNDFKPSLSLQKLFKLFENCINFVQPQGLGNVTDVDVIVRSFSNFGKISSIQDHWARPKGSFSHISSVWMGATVVYKKGEDLDRVLKASSVGKTTTLAVSVVEHLSRIHFVETRYKSPEKTWTSVSVENIGANTSRRRFLDEFSQYGKIVSSRWYKIDSKICGCLVLYESTTNAVAAALALDGRSVQKCLLRARIKMNRRTTIIHREVCELF